MIRVEEQTEPVGFGASVREPGALFLGTNPKPSSGEWEGHEYWRRAAGELYEAYDGICAYTCQKIEVVTGSATVDHFVPKSVRPSLAYEWSNFRLVCGRMNSRKGGEQDVLDPFGLENGVFGIHFPSLQVHPSANLCGEVEAGAWSTIHRLKLNDETCIRGRYCHLEPYCRGVYGLSHLAEVAPFLHREIVRQELLRPRICEVMEMRAMA